MLVLKKIVAAPIPENLSAHEIDFEHIIRAQAIEGIKSNEIIKDLIQKTDDVFLLDRLQRAQNHLEGRADSSEVQDNQQLEKILEK